MSSTPKELKEFAPVDCESIATTSKELQEFASDFQELIPGDGDSYPYYRKTTEFRLIYAIPKSLLTDESKYGGVTIHLDKEFQREDDIHFTRYFTLKCYPNGDSKENEGYISLIFERKEMLFQLRNLNVTLALLDAEKNQRFPQSFTLDHKETLDYNPQKEIKAVSVFFGLSRYMKRDTLLSSDIYCNEKLLVQCEVQYYTLENELDEGPPYVLEEWYDETGHHISLILETDHPLWAFLCEQSPYFNKLINIDGVAEISSYDKSDHRALEIILRCIMSGTDPEMHDLSMLEVFNLYEFSDYVLLPEFKQKCCDIMKKRMTARIACNVIAMADMLSDVDLKKFATQYALQHWSKVVASKSWGILSKERPDLAQEMSEWQEAKPSRKRKRVAETNSEYVQQFHFYQ